MSTAANSVSPDESPATTDAVLAELAWEKLANDLEDWLDAGHQPPFPTTLESRPAGTPPERVRRRLEELNARLADALGALHTERSGVAASLQATAQATRMTQPHRGSTPAYLDTGA
ncbi:hypothetical protein [Citricoccus sp. GCM10030269]|uniref:hypothetical protein n=1 Tax=Citricoccus sp. GCM10030269 TaxID=3273388 RepID=UPI00362146A9